MTKVLKQFPPNYSRIIEVLPAVKQRPNAVFTYAPNIYFRGQGQLDYHLIKHEEVHIRQQGADPDAWWEKYLTDPEFRYRQELEAYQAQYRAASYLNRGQRRVVLNKIASDLSSAMYGKIVTKAEALERIVNG